MKKSIVLLVSLFFIAALSILILKNLEDTNSYIDEQNSKFNKAQTIVLIKNLQTQISDIFNKNQDKIDSIIETQLYEYFPIQIEKINMFFKILPYERININKLTSEDKKEKEEIKKFFENNDIYNTEVLETLLKNKIINSNKQVDDIINIFIKETYDNKILDVRSEIGFLSDEKLYELFIKIDYIKEFVKAYYILNNKGEVKYFELSFK